LSIKQVKVVKKLKHITISEANYLTLKTLGNAGDSFNDVVTGVLKKMGSVLQFDSEVGACDQTATSTIASDQSITIGDQSNNE
jgi:predicted CopG family antitoxin